MVSTNRQEDMPLSAAKGYGFLMRQATKVERASSAREWIEDNTLFSNHSAAKLLSFISFYLHLSPFIYKTSGACES
jgi:hypothetical protein